jgi:hypothetical protein
MGDAAKILRNVKCGMVTEKGFRFRYRFRLKILTFADELAKNSFSECRK